MELPFTARLKGGFGQGRTLIVRGRPHHCNAWFAISLMDGLDFLHDKHDNPSGLVPLQVQARLNDKLVVLNTFDGHWGTEERKPGFPVKYDGVNEVKITCTGTSYEIYFNGAHFASYNHRLENNLITHFNFYGDFKVSEVVYS